MNFKIEKDIPLPRGKSNATWSKYDMDKLEVGDSFLVGDYDVNVYGKINSAAARYAVKSGNPNFKLSIRKVENNQMRVWRIS